MANEYHIISPQVLRAEVDERICAKKESLMPTLKTVPSVSTAVDVWSVHQKTFLSIIVNWLNSTDYQRQSSVIACEIFPEPLPVVAINERLKQIYADFEISEKNVATVTNNHLQSENVTFVPVLGLENRIENPTYLFELIYIEVAQKVLNSDEYYRVHQSAFSKFDALSNETNHRHLSEKSLSILMEFKPQSIVSKVNQMYSCVLNVVNCDSERLNEVSTEMGILTFSEEDMRFLKEYTMILEPIATAIEYLQKNNCHFSTILPMVYSMTENLTAMTTNGEIQLCQPLLTAILDGIKQYFEYLFDFNNEKCIPAIIATCTHPFFKMRWLKGELKTPNNTNLILDLLVRVAKQHEETKDSKNQESTSENGKFGFKNIILFEKICFYFWIIFCEHSKTLWSNLFS